MNPPRSEVRPEADGSLVVALATAPARPPIPFEATIRHPDRFRAALAAFLRSVIAEVPVRPTPGRPKVGSTTNLSPRADYSRARRACAHRLVEHDAELWRTRLAVDPIVTVADDTWIVEGFSTDLSAYARISVPHDEIVPNQSVQSGTSSVRLRADFLGSLDQIRGNVPTRLQMVSSVASPGSLEQAWPTGWLRGFAGIQSAMSLPLRRVAIDRGGLLGLITGLGRSTKVRAGRSVVIRWAPGRSAEVVVRPGARPIPLHAQAVDDGTRGSVRVAVGYRLGGLAGFLPWVDSADLFLLGPGLPSFWSVRSGGIRVLLGLPSWTLDGRLGSLRLDALAPPVEPGRFLANQVTATFRDHPAQTRRQVGDRTRGSEPEVAALLSRFAALGSVLPEPDTGLFRWRPAFDESVGDDPEPAETLAARAITETTSVQVTRDEIEPDGQSRRVEGLILDRPVAMILDADGWIRRGRCTCSHLEGGGINQRGPCRHLLALQARMEAGSARAPHDLATWFAGFPEPIPV